MSADRAALVREIVDANSYMTIATADAGGRPWATPVWFAHDDYTDFVWVSDPDARHSRNLAVNPQVGIVIFDSRAPIGSGQGVYVEAAARQLVGTAVERGIEVFSRRSQDQGARAWTRQHVTPPARHRLFRARAGAHYLLDDRDRRVAVTGVGRSSSQ